MDAIRPHLQSVTHNIPLPLQDLGESLLTEKCYRQLVRNIDVDPSSPCFRLALSKALGIAIVGASAIVKLPQIAKLASSKSASGLSLLSILLETSSFGVTLAYNVRNGFPFSTYGETALIAAQDLAIVALVLKFGSRWSNASLGGLVVAAVSIVAALAVPNSPVGMRELVALQTVSGVVGVASKIPQIWTVYQEGTTGQLSAFAVINYLLGSLSRIFTTLQEVDDPLILYGFIAGFIFNAILAAQMAYYWNASPATGRKGAKGGKRGPRKITPTPSTPASSSAVGDTPAASTRSKGPSTRRRA